MPRIFGRKKEEKMPVAKQVATVSDLEKICGDDKEAYEALASTMFLEPKRIETTIKQAVEFAKKAEKDGDLAKAGMWYEVAGGLAIHEGNVKKVIEYYGEAKRIIGRDYSIINNAEKAVAKAQEYYEKYLNA